MSMEGSFILEISPQHPKPNCLLSAFEQIRQPSTSIEVDWPVTAGLGVINVLSPWPVGSDSDCVNSAGAWYFFAPSSYLTLKSDKTLQPLITEGCREYKAYLECLFTMIRK
ncbi:hypothetical protein AVEN_270284-1 [Araneus ventricosus]|uniref:Uncharacterized protein n=1 Tax=Araneus ventricosus TaxID=182803 RepID=A0A4Y2U5N9_ARAVE|nr:hypothetical protein AVEN_270284-1 [Araneus ventricosus]